MESLVKKIDGILNSYAQTCMGNRLNPFTFKSLREIILGEIAGYKPGENKKVDNTCRPIEKKIVKEDKK